MIEFEKITKEKSAQAFKVEFPDRRKGETSKDYYQRAMSENIEKVLAKNKIQTTPEIETDFKEIANTFGQDLGKKSEEAITDLLTGLFNRRGFEENGKNLMAMAKSRRLNFGLTFGYIDLDNFKTFNDECGHSAGDNFLQIFGDLLVSNLREEDICARIGGDEFGFIMVGASLKNTKTIMNRLVKEIKFFIHEQYQGLSKPFGFSFGLESWDGKGDISKMMKRADDKLYQKKK